MQEEQVLMEALLVLPLLSPFQSPPKPQVIPPKAIHIQKASSSYSEGSGHREEEDKGNAGVNQRGFWEQSHW